MIQITLPDQPTLGMLLAAKQFFASIAEEKFAADKDAPPPLKAAEVRAHAEANELPFLEAKRQLAENPDLRREVAQVIDTAVTLAREERAASPTQEQMAQEMEVAAAPIPLPSAMPAAFGDATPPAASAPIPAASPATAETSPAPSAAGVPLDSAGIPWDGRIHSESKKTNADGTWRKRSKLPEGRYEEVLAQIKGLMAASAGSATAGAVPVPPAAPAVAATPQPVPPQSTAAMTAGSPVPIPSPTAPAPAADASISRYAELMTWLTVPMTTGTNPITVAEVGAKLKTLGELYGLPTALDLQSLKFAPVHVIDNVWAVFRQLAAERGYTV